MRVAIIGATGAVGQELVAALADVATEELGSDVPVLFGTKRSAGEVFPWLEDEELVVEEFKPEDLRGFDVALLAVPEAEALKIVPRLRELGVLTIDVSRANRRSAPLFLAEGVTPLAGAAVVAVPAPEALAIARVLAPLAAQQPAWVRATVLRAASGAGKSGVAELGESTGMLLNGQEPETPTLGHRLAFNLVPHAGAFTNGVSEAENDLAEELAVLVGNGLKVAATTAWGPWFYGHVVVATIALARPLPIDAVRAALAAAPGVKVVDSPAESVYPMPSLATGDDAVLVGRLRADPIEANAFTCVIAADNVRMTAMQALAALRSAWRTRRAH